MRLFTINRGIGIALLALFTLSSGARATETDIWLNLEGNPTCSSLGDNHAVLEYKVNSPQAVETISMATTAGGTQDLTYEVITNDDGDDEVKVWTIDGITDANQDQINPINYVILKSQGGKTGARVFHFGATEADKGATSDTNEVGAGSKLASISFCYGLTQGINPPPEPPLELADLPNCDDLSQTPTGTSDLFTTGIDCPDGGEQQLIINMALNDPNFGFNFTNDNVRACTCNVTLPACNPDLPAFDISNGPQTATSADERSCMEYGGTTSDGTPSGVNERVPFAIQGVENPDSYICYTIGGKRYCYGHY